MFTNTANKDFIRAVDYAFIKEEFEHHNKKLRYFGLPSEGLYDIMAWNEFLGDFVAVEVGAKSDPSSKQSLLVGRALQLGIHHRLTLLRGEINQILLQDKDEVGTRVPYPFELVNLDYGGSVLYPDRIRIDALEILARRQRPTDFLLLITSNAREYDQNELVEAQNRIHKEITQYRPDLNVQIKRYFEIINESESLFRQVLHLHFLIKCLAEHNRYEIACFPAILYEGSRATKLIHYIFRLRHQKAASTRVTSDQSLLDLLRQNLQEVVEGKLISIEPPQRLTA
jgi:hypothetical protein